MRSPRSFAHRRAKSISSLEGLASTCAGAVPARWYSTSPVDLADQGGRRQLVVELDDAEVEVLAERGAEVHEVVGSEAPVRRSVEPVHRRRVGGHEVVEALPGLVDPGAIAEAMAPVDVPAVGRPRLRPHLVERLGQVDRDRVAVLDDLAHLAQDRQRRRQERMESRED